MWADVPLNHIKIKILKPATGLVDIICINTLAYYIWSYLIVNLFQFVSEQNNIVMGSNPLRGKFRH